MKRAQEIRRISVLDQRGICLETTDHLRLSERFGHVSAVALHRAALHDALLSSLPTNAVRTGKKCIGVREQGDSVAVQFQHGENLRTDLLLACDGIHSVVRQSLYPEWRERFVRYTCWRGVAQTRPDGVESGHITESWGKGKRVGIVPLPDNQVYWFACLTADVPRDPQLSAMKLPGLCALFSDFHRPVLDVLSATSSDTVVWNDIFDVPPRHCYTRRRVVMLGDAAHAVTPDLGQGACQALEDAAVLSDLLAHDSFETAFARFDSLRLPRTRRLVRYSRRFARIAQVRNPYAARLRNAILRSIPNSVSERWIDSILDVQFAPVGAHGTPEKAAEAGRFRPRQR